jgi:hypothetical protein
VNLTQRLAPINLGAAASKAVLDVALFADVMAGARKAAGPGGVVGEWWPDFAALAGVKVSW